MESNSKLNRAQKAYFSNLKSIIVDAGRNVKFFVFGRVTFAVEIFPCGNGRVAWSIASKTEVKLRKKVGKLHALMRLVSTDGLPIELKSEYGDIYTPQEIAEMVLPDMADILVCE